MAMPMSLRSHISIATGWLCSPLPMAMLMCDRSDIGIAIGSGEQSQPVGEEGALTRSGQPVALPDEPRIFVYDNYPGGIGFSAPLYGMHEELLARTRALVASCACEHGCPGCVGPVGDTGPLAKTVALSILDRLGARVFAAPSSSSAPPESRIPSPESRVPSPEPRVLA